MKDEAFVAYALKRVGERHVVSFLETMVDNGWGDVVKLHTAYGLRDAFSITGDKNEINTNHILYSIKSYDALQMPQTTNKFISLIYFSAC